MTGRFPNAKNSRRDDAARLSDREHTERIDVERSVVPSRPFSEQPGHRDAANFADYGRDEIVSRGGVPRDDADVRPTPGWIHTSDTGPSRASDPYGRGVPEAFGFARPYPYAHVARADRRGRFFGRGPKGYRRSDERIQEEISDRLMSHPDIDASDIELDVADGIVTLRGTAEDRHEKRLAELIAEDVLGVDDVQNQLKVRHGLWATITGQRALERQLPTPIERDVPAPATQRGRSSTPRREPRSR